MNQRSWGKRVAIGIALACALGIIAFALAPQAALRALAGTALRVAGYKLSYDRLAISSGELNGSGIAIDNAAGEPVARIAALDVTYSIADAIAGRRAFGLKSVNIEAPQFTLIRHRDGTWNVPIPKQSASQSRAEFDFSGSLRNGRVDLYDQAQGVVAARHLEVRDINVRASVCSQCRTQYAVALAYMEEGRAYPVNGSGEIDPASGVAWHRWHAAALPIAHLADVALDSPSFHISNGVLRGLDARIAGFFSASGAIDNHVEIGARLTGGKLAIGGLAKPLRDVSGPIEVYGDGLLFPGMHATLANVPLTARGGIFDLSDPKLRLHVTGSGDLRNLRTAIPQASRVAVSGATRLDLLIEGRPSAPLMMLATQSPALRFAQSTLSGASTKVAFDGDEVDILDARAQYGNGVALGALGRVAVRPGPHALELLGTAGAAANAVPGALLVAPGMRLQGTIVATSDTLSAIDALGAVTGDANGRHAGGVFSVNGQGVGTIGPLSIEKTGGGSLYALAYVDRPHQALRAKVVSSGFPLDEDGTQVPLNGNFSAFYSRGVLRARGVAATGAAYADVNGTISRVLSGAPVYALAAHVDAAEIAPLVALADPSAARLVEGRARISARVSGTGAPVVRGTIDAPEGAVNGLAFHELGAAFDATPQSLALRGGRVDVGSTGVAFSADVSRHSQRVSVDAPHADLRDFNDFFDAGDMLSGTGSLAGSASLDTTLVATGGHVALHDVAVRDVALGAVDATWLTNGDAIESNLAVAGDNGSLRASGGVTLSGDLQGLTLHARDVDAGRLLAMAGYDQPISGRFSGDAQLSGPWSAPWGSVALRATHVSLKTIAIDSVDARATLDGSGGRLNEFQAALPDASIAGSGRFGLRLQDPFDLVFDARTNDVAALARSAFGRPLDVHATAQTQLRIRGTRFSPILDDRLVLNDVTYGRLVVPQLSASVHADKRAVTLERGEIDLQRGKVLANGTMPLRTRSVSLLVAANDVDAADVAPLLPSGTTVGGRIDGSVNLAGTLRQPRANGQLTLANGSYEGPQETVPIEGANAVLAFAGTAVTLSGARARVGGGTIDAQAQALVPDIMRPASATLVAHVSAQNASIDAPAFVKGTFNGNMQLAQHPGSIATLSGDIATDSARIPVNALYNPSAQNGAPPTLPQLGLNLRVNAGRDVRVQSPNVDIGATGQLAVRGTLRAPSLSGSFHSTGGTVAFGRTFDIQSGTVRFDPSSGIVPYVRAQATTYIDDPATDIALSVKGPATNMNLTFDSSPQYSRDQILSMLALGGSAPGGFSAGGVATSYARGQVNQLFTRNLLEPFSAQLGSALGFSNFQITSDLQSGLGVNGVKALGKVADIVYSDTFGIPRRQSISLQAHPSHGTRVALTAYMTQAPALFASGPLTLAPDTVESSATIPLESGTNGVSLDWSRTFP